MMGEVGKLLFLLTERISASLRVLRALDKVEALIYFCCDLSTPNPTLCLPVLSYRNEFVCSPAKTSHNQE